MINFEFKAYIDLDGNKCLIDGFDSRDVIIFYEYGFIYWVYSINDIIEHQVLPVKNGCIYAYRNRDYFSDLYSLKGDWDEAFYNSLFDFCFNPEKLSYILITSVSQLAQQELNVTRNSSIRCYHKYSYAGQAECEKFLKDLLNLK